MTFIDPLTSAENKLMFRLGVGGAREDLDLKTDDAKKLSSAERYYWFSSLKMIRSYKGAGNVGNLIIV